MVLCCYNKNKIYNATHCYQLEHPIKRALLNFKLFLNSEERGVVKIYHNDNNVNIYKMYERLKDKSNKYIFMCDECIKAFNELGSYMIFDPTGLFNDDVVFPGTELILKEYSDEALQMMIMKSKLMFLGISAVK